MYSKRTQRKSQNIREFANVLYQFKKYCPNELCPPETEPQFFVDCVKDAFLDKDWLISMPINSKQANTLILIEILKHHSKEFRNLCKELNLQV